MEPIPVADTMRQLMLALGAALLLGNLAVIVRERRLRDDTERPKPNMKIVGLNIAIGAILAFWAGVSLLVA